MDEKGKSLEKYGLQRVKPSLIETDWIVESRWDHWILYWKLWKPLSSHRGKKLWSNGRNRETISLP